MKNDGFKLGLAFLVFLTIGVIGVVIVESFEQYTEKSCIQNSTSVEIAKLCVDKE